MITLVPEVGPMGQIWACDRGNSMWRLNVLFEYEILVYTVQYLGSAYSLLSVCLCIFAVRLISVLHQGSNHLSYIQSK